MDEQSTSIVDSNNEQKQIFPAKDMRTQQILIGIAFSIFGLFGLGFFLPIGILSIILGCIAKYDNYVTLGSDYITIKAPIGTKKEILFDEISSIINHNNKKITLYYTIAGSDKVKKAVIALNLIAEFDRFELISALEQLDENKMA